ncbi:MAG: GAF and HD-GYP domain-containing protein [bacterium]
METIPVPKDKFDHLDFAPIDKLLKSGYRLFSHHLELRDPWGKIILSYPSSKSSLCSKKSYKEFFPGGINNKNMEPVLFDKDRSLIGIPIVAVDSFMGALIILDQSDTCPESFSKKSFKFYQDMTNLIAKEYTAQIEIISLTEELACRYDELNLFYKLGDWLKGIKEIEESIQLLIEKIADTLDVDNGFISLPENGIYILTGIFEEWKDEQQKQAYLRRLGSGFMKHFSTHREEIVLYDKNHKSKNKKLAQYFPRAMNLIAVPIRIDDQLEGTLGAFFKDISHKKQFTTSDVMLLNSMSKVISILLKNNELYLNLKSLLVNMVKCFVSAIEAKDYYTRGHSERVNYISMLIADRMNLPQNLRESINWTSILHDIGKIGIPESILTKRGALTRKEYAKIKEHPQRGYIILKPIQSQFSLDGVLYHQENYDGSGYPNGLKGEEIPLSARIIAVADTYDAITSQRAYRNNRSHQEAIAEIKRVAGKQLDPEIVRIFIKLIEEKGEEILKQENREIIYEGK